MGHTERYERNLFKNIPEGPGTALVRECRKIFPQTIICHRPIQKLSGASCFSTATKRVYATEDPERVIFHFKDVATAYNNIKKAVSRRRGWSATGFPRCFSPGSRRTGAHSFHLGTGGQGAAVPQEPQYPAGAQGPGYFAGSIAGRLGIDGRHEGPDGDLRPQLQQ